MSDSKPELQTHAYYPYCLKILKKDESDDIHNVPRIMSNDRHPAAYKEFEEITERISLNELSTSKKVL